MFLKNGKEVTADQLDQCEKEGMSEAEIAEYLGSSRMGLWKVRVRLGHPQWRRSDKGKRRVPEKVKEKKVPKEKRPTRKLVEDLIKLRKGKP